ncbi:hypothetical protein V8G54_027351, partial [Vigna mungo]
HPRPRKFVGKPTKPPSRPPKFSESHPRRRFRHQRRSHQRFWRSSESSSLKTKQRRQVWQRWVPRRRSSSPPRPAACRSRCRFGASIPTPRPSAPPCRILRLLAAPD